MLRKSHIVLIYVKNVFLWDILVNMFKGITNIRLDTKGRLTIPTKYRPIIHEQSNSKMVITIDSEEKCLLSTPALLGKIQQKSMIYQVLIKMQEESKDYLIGYAEDIDLDGNGRILLSKPLRSFAEMTKQVTMIGQGEKFEIWSNDIWEKRVTTLLEETEETEESILMDIKI